MPTRYWLNDAIVKAPEDTIEAFLHYEPPYEGDIDIQLHIATNDVIADAALEAVARSFSLSILSFLNITLGELLIPVAPLQLRKLHDANNQLHNQMKVAVRNRPTFDVSALSQSVNDFVDACAESVDDSPLALPSIPSHSKLKTALELYSGLAFERSTTVQFLLSMMVLEALADSQMKPPIVQSLISRWRSEVNELRAKCDDESEDWVALEAIERELLFRRETSIRSQIRALVREALAGSNDPAHGKYARDVVRLYDKRSVLIHTGVLPAAELESAATSTKRIVDAVLKATISRSLEENRRDRAE